MATKTTINLENNMNVSKDEAINDPQKSSLFQSGAANKRASSSGRVVEDLQCKLPQSLKRQTNEKE